MKYSFVLLLLAALAGCTHEDQAKTRQNLDKAKQEIKHDAHVVGQEVDKDLREARREVQHGVKDLKEKHRDNESDRKPSR